MSTATTLTSSPPGFTSYPRTKTIEIPGRLNQQLMEELTDRQDRLPWWMQESLNQTIVRQIGAGGLGGPTVRPLVQMGAEVDVSNLNRQLFRVDDLGKPKPHALIENISAYATRAMTLTSHWMRVEEFASISASERRCDIYSVGVDNDAANLAAARLGVFEDKTVIFTNVSRDGEACRIFIQRPGEACFACYKPRALEPSKPKLGCPRTPAIADILQVAAGIAVRAIVGEIMGEPIGPYNCRDFSFSGFDHVQTIERRPHCPVCRCTNMSAKERRP